MPLRECNKERQRQRNLHSDPKLINRKRLGYVIRESQIDEYVREEKGK